MITDIISLNLIVLYLDQFEQNQGKIDSIEISVFNRFTDTTKGLVSFANINALKAYVAKNAPLISEEDVSCFPLNMYELKSFNVTIDLGESISNKNFVWNNNRTFQTDSANINQANMIIMQEYATEFLKVLKEYNALIINEYILIQYTYIDCGYIQVYFGESYDRLIELYKKYK